MQYPLAKDELLSGLVGHRQVRDRELDVVLLVRKVHKNK
jgi:hypothetical protein